jgi:hypothetical protein
MTLTDDTLVRELAERADRAIPAMALDPAGVLAAGRRHRRRQTAIRSVGGFALVAVAAVGVVQLGGYRSATPPATATAVLAEGLVATAANDAHVAEDGGTLNLTDGAGHTYTVRFDAAAGAVEAFEGEVAGAQGDDGFLGGFSAGADGADEGEGLLQASGLDGDALLVAGYVSGPGDVRLEWSDAGRTHTLDLPTFAVPGAAGRVYVVRIEGAARDGEWPTVAVVHSGNDEHRADVPLTPLAELAVVADEPVVTVAEAVTEVETDIGPAVDLGIQVGDIWDPLDQGLTYALRAGALVDEDSRTPDDAGLWLVTLAPDGSTVTGAGGSVDDALAPANRNPIWSAGLTDHEAYMVGIRPPALEGATVELVLETDGDDVRTPIPTFRVPGLDADVWFVVLTDPVARTNWQDAMILVTEADGSSSMWNLAGNELNKLTVEPGGQ